MSEKNGITLDISVPLTSEMMATPLAIGLHMLSFGPKYV